MSSSRADRPRQSRSSSSWLGSPRWSAVVPAHCTRRACALGRGASLFLSALPPVIRANRQRTARNGLRCLSLCTTAALGFRRQRTRAARSPREDQQLQSLERTGSADGRRPAMSHSLLWALLALAACGADVRVERDSDGVGAGAGAPGGGAPSATSSTGGSTPNALRVACATWCEARTACGANETCLDACLEQGSYLGPCELAFEAWLQCSASLSLEPPSCDPPGCSAAAEALLACIYPAWPCEIRQCWIGVSPEPAMACAVSCGSVLYESICGEESAEYPRDCVCLIDGATVGQCQNLTANGSSSFDCCSAFFAESE